MLKPLLCSILLLNLLVFSLSATASPLLSSFSRSLDNHIKIPLTKRAPWNTPRSLDSLRTEVAQAIKKYDRGFTAYKTNTGHDHPLASSFYARHLNFSLAVRKRSTSQDLLTPAQDATMWSGNITVGMPQQSFTVDFDTGSADLFLPGPNCITCKGHSVYDPSRSETAHGLVYGFTLQYGDGSTVTGWQFEDTVSIVGLEANEQTLGAASIFSKELAADVFEADGILGMGFSALTQLNGAPVFETMMRQGQMESGVFSFRLAASNEGSSELYLGGVDSRFYTGNFTYTEVTVPAYWQTTLSALKIGSRLIGDDIPAIVDTGTTLILGDEVRVRMLYEQIPGAREIPDNSGFWEIPCLSPAVALVFGGKAFPLLPQAFVLAAQEAGEPGFCVGSIVAYMQSSSEGSSDPGFWVVGDAFLRGVYSTFDVDNKRIGFADLRSILDHI